MGTLVGGFVGLWQRSSCLDADPSSSMMHPHLLPRVLTGAPLTRRGREVRWGSSRRASHTCCHNRHIPSRLLGCLLSAPVLWRVLSCSFVFLFFAAAVTGMGTYGYDFVWVWVA